MEFYEQRTPTLRPVHDALLDKCGLQRGDKMLMNFDIELDVQPLAPGQTAAPLKPK